MYSTFFIALFGIAVVAGPVHRKRVDSSLIPPLGIVAGTNPDGHGNCDGAIGATGKPILIPCACPPSQDVLLESLNANVAANHATNNPTVNVAFPTDNSVSSQITRIQAILVTLQNLHGPGVGCPASSTTLLALQKSLQNGTPPPAAAPVQSSPPPASNNEPTSSDSSVASLAPDLGFTSGINPTGTGDCVGAVKGANGQPIKIPCSCPPARSEFISQLEANVAAGHAVHNSGVSVSFPLDNSPASQRARIVASLITIQNLNGPGVGCPASSTTLSAQLEAVKG